MASFWSVITRAESTPCAARFRHPAPVQSLKGNSVANSLIEQR